MRMQWFALPSPVRKHASSPHPQQHFLLPFFFLVGILTKERCNLTIVSFLKKKYGTFHEFACLPNFLHIVPLLVSALPKSEHCS